MTSYPTTLDHFSHPHSLNLIQTGQPGHANPALCSACETWTSGWTYKCSRNCSFFIDASCSSLPRIITHPAHFKPHHQLHLLATPAHAAGSFRCDGCGNHGNGFSYRCTTPGCDFDLHVVCASKPLMASRCSHGHQLSLTFTPPYGKFNCNICRTAGSNHWLYHCVLCNFNAHLGCVEAAEYSSVHQSPSWSHQPMQQSSMVPAGVGATPIVYVVGSQGTGGMNPSQPVAVAPTFGNAMATAAAQGAAQGVTQQIAQTFVQSLTGDSGSKPDNGGGGGGATSNDAATSDDSFSLWDLI